MEGERRLPIDPPRTHISLLTSHTYILHPELESAAAAQPPQRRPHSPKIALPRSALLPLALLAFAAAALASAPSSRSSSSAASSTMSPPAPLSLATGGGSAAGHVASSHLAAASQRTRRPITTGTSVLGLTYRDGVMLAADTLVSYGSMAKYKDASRLCAVGDRTLIGAGGEFSDFQALSDLLRRNALEEKCTADSLYPEEGAGGGEGAMNSAGEVWSYLRAVMYQRRNKMNPLWNDVLVAGMGGEDGSEPFLGSVDKIGTAYTDDTLATGFGSYLALPIMRERWRPDLEEGEARALLEDCLRVLFYRDCRAYNRVQIAKVTRDGGVLVSDPYEIDTKWDSASFVEPKGQLDGDGGW